VTRVTADSNIYISALLFGGPPDDILKLAEQGEIHLSISGAILDEVSRVLRDKFRLSPEELQMALTRIEGMTEKVNSTQTVDVVKEDPTDNRILECAQAGKSEYLVTRDKHLLQLGTFQGTKIILAADFLETFRAQGQGR
jgi:putative PIN family toxin of toxin-antitoxin system